MCGVQGLCPRWVPNACSPPSFCEAIKQYAKVLLQAAYVTIWPHDLVLKLGGTCLRWENTGILWILCTTATCQILQEFGEQAVGKDLNGDQSGEQALSGFGMSSIREALGFWCRFRKQRWTLPMLTKVKRAQRSAKNPALWWRARKTAMSMHVCKYTCRCIRCGSRETWKARTHITSNVAIKRQTPRKNMQRLRTRKGNWWDTARAKVSTGAKPLERRALKCAA